MDWDPMDWLKLSLMARPMWVVWMVLLFAGVLIYALRPRNKGHFEDCARIPFRGDSEGQTNE